MTFFIGIYIWSQMTSYMNQVCRFAHLSFLSMCLVQNYSKLTGTNCFKKNCKYEIMRLSTYKGPPTQKSFHFIHQKVRCWRDTTQVDVDNIYDGCATSQTVWIRCKKITVLSNNNFHTSCKLYTIRFNLI
jgi:hypothetical protein